MFRLTLKILGSQKNVLRYFMLSEKGFCHQYSPANVLRIYILTIFQNTFSTIFCIFITES